MKSLIGLLLLDKSRHMCFWFVILFFCITVVPDVFGGGILQFGGNILARS